jgi:hypothetical protein
MLIVFTIDYPLNHVTSEGVTELEEAVNEFILWNRREIVLDGPATPKDKEASLPMSQKDKEASPLTKSSPSVPRFNETSLPLSLKEKEASPPTSQKDKEASPLTKSSPSVPRFNETLLPLSPKEKEASPLPETNPPPKQDLPPPSPYKTIHQDLGLDEPITCSDPTKKFFEGIKKQKMSAMSALAHH